jgi:hypothetical protein
MGREKIEHTVRSLSPTRRGGYGTTAYELLSDLKERVTDRFQLTTDGFPAYADAVRAYPLSPLVRFSAHLGSEE